jgi:hypothetical protein
VSKSTVLQRLDKEWQSFLKSIDGMPDQILFEPDVVGVWSIRDVMAHVTTWEEESLKFIPVILEGKTPPRYITLGGIHVFNARETERKRDLSPEQVKNQLQNTHQKLITYLKSIPEDEYISGSRFLRRLSQDTYRHYHEHAVQINDWREKHGHH